MSNVNTENSNSIAGVIDKVRELIRQTSDDSVYADEFLYSILLDHRNLLLYRELNKNKYISKFLYKTICMPLIESNQIPCDCLPDGLGCTVLRSKYKIPKPLRSQSYLLLKVLTLDGNHEFGYQEIRVGKYNKYKRTNSLKAYYTIYNEYLYIIGYPNNRLKAVLVEMILEDPSQADSISLCDENGNDQEETCFDPLFDTFQIDAHLVAPMIEMTLKTLTIPLQLPEDTSNDSVSVPFEKKY